jgi:hypothetical protein
MAPSRGKHEDDYGGERKKKRVYANLLVDVVRRHSLLPSDHVEKRLRYLTLTQTSLAGWHWHGLWFKQV